MISSSVNKRRKTGDNSASLVSGDEYEEEHAGKSNKKQGY